MTLTPCRRTHRQQVHVPAARGERIARLRAQRAEHEPDHRPVRLADEGELGFGGRPEQVHQVRRVRVPVQRVGGERSESGQIVGNGRAYAGSRGDGHRSTSAYCNSTELVKLGSKNYHNPYRRRLIRPESEAWATQA